MPTDLVRVWTVQTWPADGYTVFEIRTTGPVVTTNDAFKASLCQRAKEQQRAIRLTWHAAGRRRQYLDAVELEPLDAESGAA